jgi:hypothetical protein
VRKWAESKADTIVDVNEIQAQPSCKLVQIYNKLSVWMLANKLLDGIGNLPRSNCSFRLFKKFRSADQGRAGVVTGT